jgi:transposase, IS30 family
LKDRSHGGDLYKHLRHKNKKYRKRYGSPNMHGAVKNRRFIDERPAIINDKSRMGDWEIDTIIGKNHMHAIVSIVDCKSKFTILKKVPRKTAANVSKATIDGLNNYRDKVFSITSDNGSEFAKHEEISSQLNTDFYFFHPYSSWERGLNENTNGLVRQYLKKGSCFTSVTDDSLALIMDKLNSRPRKTLGYRCPATCFI